VVGGLVVVVVRGTFVVVVVVRGTFVVVVVGGFVVVVVGGLVVVVVGGFVVVVVVELGADNRIGGGAAVAVEVEVPGEREVVGTGTNGKVIVRGEVRIVGVVERRTFLVGADVDGAGETAVVAAVVGGGSKGVVVVSLLSLCPAVLTSLMDRTARGTCPSRYTTKPKATTAEIKTMTRAQTSALRLSLLDRCIGMLQLSLPRPGRYSQGVDRESEKESESVLRGH
jgi:hypothetical protein